MKSFLFVCTGNTCRSPMAEHLAKAHWGNDLKISSAGIFAQPGAPLSRGSRYALNQMGIDVKTHASRPLTLDFLEQFDCVITMEKHHKMNVLRIAPTKDVYMLSELREKGHEEGVMDPIGGPNDLYVKTALHIEKCILFWKGCWHES